MYEQAPVQDGTAVVYIEADRSNALLMQFLLDSRSNYTLHHAKNGRSGLELCTRVKPDLVITEMHLPDLSAYDVLRALRENPATSGVPCIVLSSDAMPAHIQQALTSGFDGYWTKPIDIWRLMQNIDDIATVAAMKPRWREIASRAATGRFKAGQAGVWPGATLQNCCLSV